jgi:hypothetical protein
MSSAAERKRDQRVRVRSGRVALRIGCDEAALSAMLLNGKLITPTEQDDKRELGEALSRLLDLVLESDLSQCDAREIQKLLDVIREK